VPTTIVPPSRLPSLYASGQGELVWWSGSGPSLVAHDVRTGAAAALAPVAAPRVGRILQVEHVADVVIVRDDVALRGYDARSGAQLWRRLNPSESVIADVIGERVVLAGHEGEDLALVFLSPRDGTTDPIVTLDETMRYAERRFARRGAVLHFVTDRRALLAIDLVSRVVVARSPIAADRVRPIVSAAGRPIVAWTRDGPGGARTTIAAVDEDGALREELVLDGDCTAFAASTRVVAAEVLSSPVYGARRVHAWLAGDPASAIALRTGGRLFPAGERMVVVNDGTGDLIEPQDGRLGVFAVRLPRNPLFAGGRAFLPGAGGALSSVELRALPAAPSTGHAPAAPPPPREGAVILPPARAVTGEHRRLEPLDAARFLEERGIPVAPLYEWLVRLYYGDAMFRWRVESLGVILRDPRRPWLEGRVVFAEGSDGALFAFEGAAVVRCDTFTNATTPFAPSFDAYLAAVLADSDRPGALEMVLAALGLDASFLSGE
jgi:hypothetical protein